MAPSRDGFLAAWNCAGRVVLRELDASGRPLSSAEELGAGGCPAIATSDDTISVAWMSEDEIRLARFDEGGTIIGDPAPVVPVDTYNLLVVNVSMAADANGLALVWAEDPSGLGSRAIRFAGLDSEGTLVDGPRTVAAAPEDGSQGPDGPAVATASSGFVAVWYGLEDIEMHPLDRDGTPVGEMTSQEAWVPNAFCCDNEVGLVSAPLRMVSDHSSVVVAWTRYLSELEDPPRTQVLIHVTSEATPSLDAGVMTTFRTTVGRVSSLVPAAAPDGYLVAWQSGPPFVDLPGADGDGILWSNLNDAGQAVGALGFARADLAQDRNAIAVAHGDDGYVVVFSTRDGGLFALPLQG